MNLTTNRHHDTLEIYGNDSQIKEFKKILAEYLGLTSDNNLDFSMINLITSQHPKARQIAFKRRIELYLSLSLDCPPSSITNPADYEEFHAELLDHPKQEIKIDEFRQLQIDIPYYQAAILIETFCANQDHSCQYQFRKACYTEPQIIELSIIAPLPVLFTPCIIRETECCRLTFADTSYASAQLIHDQVLFALKCFQAVKIICITVSNVDSSAFSKPGLLSDLNSKLNLSFLVSPLQGSQYSKVDKHVGTFTMWIIPNKPGPQPREYIRKVTEEWFEKELKTYKCDKCNQYYSGGTQKQCEECFHTGTREQFEDGQMEHIEFDEEGRQIKIIKYTCCGEIVEGDPPCAVVPFGDHEHNKEPSISTFDFQVS